MKPNHRTGRVRPSKSVESDTLRQEAGPLYVMAHTQRRVFAWALATLVSLFAGCDSLCENQEVHAQLHHLANGLPSHLHVTVAPQLKKAARFHSLPKTQHS
ncbi:hypothetical protein D3C71_1884670 [compost metagenome]